jgi:hypothetical protein
MAARQELPDGLELRPGPRIMLERIAKPDNEQTLCGRLTLVNRGCATVFYRLKVSGYIKGVSGIGARGQVHPDNDHPVTLLLTPEAADQAQLHLKLSFQGVDYAVRLCMVQPEPVVSPPPSCSTSGSLLLEAIAVKSGDAASHRRDNIDACVRSAVADVFMRMATLARSRTGPSSLVEMPDEGHVSDVIMDQVNKRLRRIHHAVPSKSSVDAKPVRTDS